MYKSFLSWVAVVHDTDKKKNNSITWGNIPYHAWTASATRFSCMDQNKYRQPWWHLYFMVRVGVVSLWRSNLSHVLSFWRAYASGWTYSYLTIPPCLTSRAGWNSLPSKSTFTDIMCISNSNAPRSILSAPSPLMNFKMRNASRKKMRNEQENPGSKRADQKRCYVGFVNTRTLRTSRNMK